MISDWEFWVVVAFSAAMPMYAQDSAAGGKRRPKCAPPATGLTATRRRSDLPALAGQTARYIYLQLKDFNEGRRSVR